MSYPLIAIMGGTFDPIHCGHLAVAEYLTTHLPLSQLQFIPCLQPPHRQSPQASPEQRLAMLKLAVDMHPSWIVNDIDYQRPGPSYMADTLQLLRQQQPQTSWALILGMDAFIQLNQWHQWQQILKLAHLIVVNRPGFELPTVDWCDNLLKAAQVNSADYFQNHLAGGILLQAIPPSPVSATAIRQFINAGTQQKIAVSTSVLKYIQKHKLYQSIATKPPC